MNQLGTIVNYVCIVLWTTTTSVISLSAVSAALSAWTCTMGGGVKRGGDMRCLMCCSFTCVLSLHLFICFLWGWFGDFLWLFMLRKWSQDCWLAVSDMEKTQDSISSGHVGPFFVCFVCFLVLSTCSKEILPFNWKYSDLWWCIQVSG